MFAAVTVPRRAPFTVAGPPPSLMATKLSGLISRPYFALRPGNPCLRLRELRGAPNFTSAACGTRSAMVLRFHRCAVASVTVTVSVSLAGAG